MSLRKDDPIYYRNKIRDLLKQAKENDIEITLNDGFLSFAVYSDKEFLEKYKVNFRDEGFGIDNAVCRASVNINDFM